MTEDDPRPIRIKMVRKKGWQAPEGLDGRRPVYVGRGAGNYGRWGNPFPWRRFLWWMGNDETVDKARMMISTSLFYAALDQGKLQFTGSDIRNELNARNLMCWCPLDRPCHGDVLLAVANLDPEYLHYGFVPWAEKVVSAHIDRPVSKLTEMQIIEIDRAAVEQMSEKMTGNGDAA